MKIIRDKQETDSPRKSPRKTPRKIKPIETHLIRSARVGDTWVILNHLRLIEADAVYCEAQNYEFCCKLNNLLSGDLKIIRVEDPVAGAYNHVYEGEKASCTMISRTLAKRIRNNYLPTKVTWSYNGSHRGKVCYSIDYVTGGKKKSLPNAIDLKGILEEHFEQVVLVDKPMAFERVVNHLATCSVFVTNESGLAHIANSVGVPTVLLTHIRNKTRGRKWQPDRFPMCHEVHDIMDVIDQLLS